MTTLKTLTPLSLKTHRSINKYTPNINNNNNYGGSERRKDDDDDDSVTATTATHTTGAKVIGALPYINIWWLRDGGEQRAAGLRGRAAF